MCVCVCGGGGGGGGGNIKSYHREKTDEEISMSSKDQECPIAKLLVHLKHLASLCVGILSVAIYVHMHYNAQSSLCMKTLGCIYTHTHNVIGNGPAFLIFKLPLLP